MLFALLIWQAQREPNRRRPGLLTGVFLAGYGSVRTVVELFRQPDAHLGFLSFGSTMGQWLSVPLILAGMFLIVRSRSLRV